MEVPLVSRMEVGTSVKYGSTTSGSTAQGQVWKYDSGGTAEAWKWMYCTSDRSGCTAQVWKCTSVLFLASEESTGRGRFSSERNLASEEKALKLMFVSRRKKKLTKAISRSIVLARENKTFSKK
ncbi:hypothetical protein CEXT_260241 [Caerostris extrusa]|uniref:Uncharacterized protein n=1 Tax=Caerostris extrusa TaxID=172846 RepID=A0AAV4PWJ6_CAEEX|nr:hypothetical protein CEXT_260241 [Caerostris extrusa]